MRTSPKARFLLFSVYMYMVVEREEQEGKEDHRSLQEDFIDSVLAPPSYE